MEAPHPDFDSQFETAPAPRSFWLVPFIAGLLLGIATALAAVWN
jgi:hypothetical protein